MATAVLSLLPEQLDFPIKPGSNLSKSDAASDRKAFAQQVQRRIAQLTGIPWRLNWLTSFLVTGKLWLSSNFGIKSISLGYRVHGSLRRGW